jgi:hypothetical protein
MKIINHYFTLNRRKKALALPTSVVILFEFYHVVALYLFITKFVLQFRTGLQIYEGHDDQLNRPGPMT